MLYNFGMENNAISVEKKWFASNVVDVQPHTTYNLTHRCVIKATNLWNQKIKINDWIHLDLCGG